MSLNRVKLLPPNTKRLLGIRHPSSLCLQKRALFSIYIHEGNCCGLIQNHYNNFFAVLDAKIPNSTLKPPKTAIT